MPTPNPPDIPASVGKPVQEYLRRLNTWAFQSISDKVSKTEAQSSVLLTPSDQKNPNTVFAITVDSTGTLSVTQVKLGSRPPP